MRAKEFLRQIRILDTSINNIRLEIMNTELKMSGLSSGESQERGKSSNVNSKSPQEIYYAKLDELKKELERMCDERMSKIAIAIQLIDKLSNPLYAQVLYSKYVRFKTYEEIAEERGVNPRVVRRTHSRALKQFEIIYSGALVRP